MLKMNVNKCLHCLTEKSHKFIYRVSPTARFRLVCNEKLVVKHKSIKPLSKFLRISSLRLEVVTFLSNEPNIEQTPNSNLDIFRSLKPLEFDNISFSPPVSHEDLLNNLQDCKTISEQMNRLVTTMSLTEDDVQNRIYFCKTLETLFKPFFTNFEIQMFGSTVNGFGFKGCDIDMSFETESKGKSETEFYLDPPDIPLVGEVLSGQVSPKELSELPFKEQLIFIHNVLLDYYQHAELPPIFINAYVPLVRLYHDKFNLKCDLTLKNQVAFANTRLLYLFGKYDNRVTPLLMTIRYWAKHVELVGKGLLFNTYTISLMVIYFLQSRNPPILPKAQDFMSLADNFNKEDRNYQSYLEILTKLPPSANTQTLCELLREFFFFYLYFDFTRVICPLIGASVTRDVFFAKEENKKFRMNSICVQDPLCEDHNVADLVDYKICKKFFTELLLVCKIFQDNEIFYPGCEPWGLMSLFDKSTIYLLQSLSRQKVISFPILLSSLKNSSTPNLEKASSERILKILRDILLIECTILEKDEVLTLLTNLDGLLKLKKKALTKDVADLKSQFISWSSKKSRRVLSEDQSELHDLSDESVLDHFKNCNEKYELVLCVKCIASKNTWLGRDLASLEIGSGKDALEREILISQTVAKQNDLNITDKIKPFDFLYECYRKPEESELVVNFRPLKRSSFNPILGTFLKEFIPRILNEI